MRLLQVRRLILLWCVWSIFTPFYSSFWFLFVIKTQCRTFVVPCDSSRMNLSYINVCNFKVLNGFLSVLTLRLFYFVKETRCVVYVVAFIISSGQLDAYWTWILIILLYFGCIKIVYFVICILLKVESLVSAWMLVPYLNLLEYYF